MEVLEKLKAALPTPQSNEEEAPPPPRLPPNANQVPSLPAGYDPHQAQAQQAALMQRQAAGQMIEVPGVGMVPRHIYEQAMAQRLQARSVANQNTPFHAPEKLWAFALLALVLLGGGAAWFLSYLTSASPSNQLMEISKLNAQAAVEAAKRPPPSVSVNCLFGCGDAAKEATKSLQQQYPAPTAPTAAAPVAPTYQPYQPPSTPSDPSYGGGQLYNPNAPAVPTASVTPAAPPYQQAGYPQSYTQGGYTAQVR